MPLAVKNIFKKQVEMRLSDLLKNQLNISGINNYRVNSDMLIGHLFNQVYSITGKLEKNITVKNWKSKKHELLKNLEYCLGLKNLPERTPLKAKTAGKIEKEKYYIEKIIFESFRNIFVPAHLYIPKRGRSPVPAILHIPGHWMENSKMEPDLQKCCIGLVKLGFVVLIIDPMEQGERRIDWKTHGHLQALLVGITQMGMMVYENLKAIDYLRSRNEVDKERIGMMGTSGGGGNTIYTTPFDQRIKVAVPVCSAVTFPGLLEGHKGYNWDGAVDLCNQVPRVIDMLTFANLLALNAPRPIMIINAESDINFPIRSAKEVFLKAKPFFDLYSSNLLKQTIVPGVHGLGQDARESIYGFFSKHLMRQGDGSPIPEQDIEIEEPPYSINYIEARADRDKTQSFHPKKDLPTYVFDNKNLKDIKKPLQHILIKRFKETYKKPEMPSNLENWDGQKNKYRQRLKQLMVKTIDHSPLNQKIVSSTGGPGYYIERIILNSEDNITIPGLLFLPDNWIEPVNVWICLDDNGKQGFIHNHFFNDLIDAKQAIFTIDLRGQGESLSAEFESATISYMIDRDLFSQRLFDLLRVVEYISVRSPTGIQLNKQNIFCYGKGGTALAALFAGAIDERVAGVFSENQIVSYRNLLEGESKFSSSIYIYNILSDFDIDIISSLIFPKPLAILNPLDRQKRAIGKKGISREFDFTKNIYSKFNQGNRLMIQHQKDNNYLKIIRKICEFDK